MCPCSAATNIFIHGNDEQGQLTNEVRFLWGQNQILKEQLNMGSRGKTFLYVLILIHVFSASRQTVLE